MDMSQYRDLFLSEAREHLQNIDHLMLALELDPAESENVNALFRSAHSLKGMAASMGYDPIAELAHRMEDLMSRVRSGEFQFSKRIASLLLEASDVLALLMDDVAMDRPLAADISLLSERLSGFTLTSEPAEHHESSVIAEGEKPQLPLAEINPEQFHTVRVKTEILDRLIDTTGELVTSKHRIMNLTQDIAEPKLKEALNDVGRLLRELHHTVMQVRLMPFATLAERFPRVVREVAKKSGKDVSFLVEGKEIELDRGVLEELADPLLHILRNAVDHGIEAPDARNSSGKNPVGRVKLSLVREKDQAIISVADDGKGMDPERLIRSAVSKGLLTAEKGAQLTPSDAYMLTCLAGFSTASEVTDISGRGVGMDAVRAAVQSMGGSLSIDSEIGRGSTICLRLPLSIAIINVLLVTAGNVRMAIPVSSVLKTLEITREQIVMRDRRAYLLLGDDEITIVSLNRIMGIPLHGNQYGFLPVIMAMHKGQPIGLLVDRVLGQHEIHVKPVGRPLNRMSGLAGGGLLGDGEIVFVVDPATLL